MLPFVLEKEAGMLIEHTLFGITDKVKTAIQRLRAFEPPEGYHVAFSGGKDSQVVYHLCKDAGVKFDAHYSLTTVDPPEVIYLLPIPNRQMKKPNLLSPIRKRNLSCGISIIRQRNCSTAITRTTIPTQRWICLLTRHTSDVMLPNTVSVKCFSVARM